MSDKMLAPIKITGNQRKWLEKEQKRTGNTFAVIIRALIQERAERTGK